MGLNIGLPLLGLIYIFSSPRTELQVNPQYSSGAPVHRGFHLLFTEDKTDAAKKNKKILIIIHTNLIL